MTRTAHGPLTRQSPPDHGIELWWEGGRSVSVEREPSGRRLLTERPLRGIELPPARADR
jgi:hypothetical protein